MQRASVVRALFYNIFPHHFLNGTIFGKKLLITKCVFFLQISFEIFLILRRNERDVIKAFKRSSCNVRTCYY
jgi:hypothetical protein